MLNKNEFVSGTLLLMAGYFLSKWVLFDKGLEYLFIVLMILLFLYGLVMAELNRRETNYQKEKVKKNENKTN
jgi:preprotein translocase subunit SecG